MKKLEIGLAMSGGVDSTATALMLKDHYNVTGFFMQLAQPDLEQQVQRVSTMAERVGVPLKIIDLTQQFQKYVLEYFSGSYFSGLTPNPCMICNKEIKFGLFLETVLSNGMDKMATGHYARVEKRKNIYHLLKGLDPKKDQSYFLSRLNQQQLSSILFPLGAKHKTEIYDYIEQNGFTTFRGEESQDVCFLGNETIGEYLQQHFPGTNTPGALKTAEGNVLGQHQGLQNYTIGQRKGLGISDATPYYVTKLDPSDNSVIVGKDEDLFYDSIILKGIHWLSNSVPDMSQQYQVRIRYSHKGSSASLKLTSDNQLQIQFLDQQRAITPGQFAVIYNGDEVIGSGEIC